jgi:secondary thiamine-phosphate synthase enzyme
MIDHIVISTSGQGLYEFTNEVRGIVEGGGRAEGLCTLFVQHTSASLTIQENADPSARRDLEAWIDRLVPERDPHFTHTAEGPDDMPAHIKAALTATSLTVPLVDGRLALGTWQGIYLWEHRHSPHRRRIVVHVTD